MQTIRWEWQEMANQVNNAPDYGNWVSKRLVYTFGVLGVVFLALAFLFWVSVIPALLSMGVAAYFAYARYLFSPKGGNVQNQIWDTVAANLDWNGEGKALDIGCGNGALTIRLASKFTGAQVTGIDYWGERWEYSKSTCEANAKAESVNDRVVFQKASASKLPFEDEYFDAAVSNLCFHEVSDAKDKREVIREALRVVKKGGKFAFQDLFLLKQIYGEPEELVATVKSWGVTEVEFVETRNAPFIPGALKLPFMVGRIGIIKGEK
jgi:SAM-dependent methyltransferase